MEGGSPSHDCLSSSVRVPLTGARTAIQNNGRVLSPTLNVSQASVRFPVFYRLAVAGFVAVALACATTTRRPATGTSPSVLLADEISAAGARTVHDAIARLRPSWLRGRRGRISMQDPTAGEVVVYLDGARYGGQRSLASIRVETVLDLTFLAASDATTRFGTGHGGGAILIRTR